MKKLAYMTAVLMLAACSQPGTMGAAAPTGPVALARLQPTQGNSASGSVTFRQQGSQVMVTADISGLKPNAEHGFHVHDKGDCSASDGMSTGGHYNPTAQPHGPQAAGHHAGDMPSLKADADGKVRSSFALTGVSIGPAGTDLVGHGLIVHAQPDDYMTQPTGNAGARIACGVITLQ